ncbi:MAG: hypothetical protein HC804_10565, partial [Anaerolineae bacterium]|nr:hypothetical protein [Anaerolineae bacterium]
GMGVFVAVGWEVGVVEGSEVGEKATVGGGAVGVLVAVAVGEDTAVTVADCVELGNGDGGTAVSTATTTAW